MKNLLSEIILGVTTPIVKRLKYLNEIRRYKKDAYPEIFPIEWTDIPYNRIAVVNILVKKTNCQSYLEIGCDTNGLFHSIPVINKIGVDPYSGGNVRLESDEFFKGNSKFFDLIFIDGLHTYDQVRRDVLNSLECTKKGGWVALHDMMPRSWIEEHVPRIGEGSWTGDVWKIAFELLKTEGIDFRIIKAERGIGVFKLIGDKVELFDNKKFLDSVAFRYYCENFNELPILEYDEALKWIEEEIH